MNEGLKLRIDLAHKHFAAGEYTEAQVQLSLILQEDDSFADLLNMQGVIYHSKDLYKEAERSFEKALAINPNYTDAALNLSVTYNDRGKYNEARKIYSRAIQNSSDKQNEGGDDPYARGKIANMHAELGDAYAEIGRNHDAVREYERALDLSPGFVDIRTRLGHVLREMDRTEDALPHYTRVKQEKPDYLPARLALGVTLFSLERTEEAIAEWNDCIAIAPGDRRATMYLRMVNAEGAAKPGSATPKGKSKSR